MSLTMYTATVPTCTRALNSLAAILEKAAAHAEVRKIDPATLLGSRLFPDMFPLATQIHIANDIAEGIAATRGSVAYLESLKPAQFDGSEDRTVTWQTRTSTKNMQGTPYLFHHVLPNVFFHVTTAYDILRQAGLEIGKPDYLGRA